MVRFHCHGEKEDFVPTEGTLPVLTVGTQED
jgi:hypothetical protein